MPATRRRRRRVAGWRFCSQVTLDPNQVRHLTKTVEKPVSIVRELTVVICRRTLGGRGPGSGRHIFPHDAYLLSVINLNSNRSTKQPLKHEHAHSDHPAPGHAPALQSTAKTAVKNRQKKKVNSAIGTNVTRNYHHMWGVLVWRRLVWRIGLRQMWQRLWMFRQPLSDSGSPVRRRVWRRVWSEIVNGSRPGGRMGVAGLYNGISRNVINNAATAGFPARDNRGFDVY
jgi:hypothetical protein